MKIDSLLMMAVIEPAGIPALRAAFTVAVIIFLSAGVFIWRRRHQFFNRDPDVENDVPVVRHNREEAICLGRPIPAAAQHFVPGVDGMT